MAGIFTSKLSQLTLAAFIGLVVSEKLLRQDERLSSPSNIITTKGSSVWLHWNYTYVGDGRIGFLTLAYKEQTIRANSTSQTRVKLLAKRTGETDTLTLESPVPAPFKGRIQVISSNSTFVIHDLQYNDSTHQFTSVAIVAIDFGAGFKLHSFYLRPRVSITVNGIPEFISQPPSSLVLNEGSNLRLMVEMDGNPKPSADFKWPHLIGSLPINAQSVQLYPFVYSSTYTLNNIDANYCGRVLETTIKNSIGMSAVKKTIVTVLLKLDQPFGLKTDKYVESSCIRVHWKKAEYGACCVKYAIAFKNASGEVLYTKSGCNTERAVMCSSIAYTAITDVQMTVSFKAASKIVTAQVQERGVTRSIALPTPPSNVPKASEEASKRHRIKKPNPVSEEASKRQRIMNSTQMIPIMLAASFFFCCTAMCTGYKE